MLEQMRKSSRSLLIYIIFGIIIAVFVVSAMVPTIYLAVKYPDALQRRTRSGPLAETRMFQKIINIGIILTIDTLSALLMTLPAMASSAVKRAPNDPRMRITYPLREFEIELGPDNLRILTIGTPEGFNVSFSLTEEFSYELGEAHLSGVGQHPRRH